MKINICYLVVQGLILSDEKGNSAPSRVYWNVDNGYLDLLPMMKTDIMLEYQGKTTIIDAKYYSKVLQYNPFYNSKTLHSHNMYQIFTYVKNKDINNEGNVRGVLLYAKTVEEEALDQTYVMSGNEISVKTLDLNQDFEVIKSRLNAIAEKMM